MIRSLTTTALVGACFAAATSQAAEVTFSGSVDAGTLITLDTLADAPFYDHNLEANLTADIKLSDAVSAQLYGAALAGAVPTGVPADNGRWPGFAFDGATITWKVGEDMTLVFGDVVIGKGSIGYYALKRYTSGARTQAVQGVSLSSGGFTGYVGNPDIRQDVTAFGASYMATLSEGMTLEPFADVTTGISKELPWTAGAQFKGGFGPLALAATGSVFGADGGDGKHAIAFASVVEPNLTFGAFTWANTLVYAPKAEANGKGEYPVYSFPIRHGRSYDAIEQDLIVYTEPGYTISDVVATGLAFEYLEDDLSEEKTETMLITPNLYLYPAEGASITLYAGAAVPTSETDGEADPTTFYAGMETIFKF